MTKKLVRHCIPISTNAIDQPIDLKTSSQTISRHRNYTDTTEDKLASRLARKRYLSCSSVKALLFHMDNKNIPRSCQFNFIKDFGEWYIEICSKLFELYERPIYHITIVCDDWNQNEEAPVFFVKKCRDQIRSFINRNIPNSNAVGFIEFQYIENKKLKSKESLIAMHCHMIVYNTRLSKKRREKIKKRCRKFHSKLTKHPIYIQKVTNKDNDKHRVFSYQVKLATKKLVLNTTGNKIKRAKRHISFKQQMRIMEILSYIPIRDRVFSIGHGSIIRRDLCSRLNQLRSRLADPDAIIDERHLRRTWRRYWRAEGIKHYKHPKVYL